MLYWTQSSIGWTAIEPRLQKVSKRNFENRLLKSALSRIIRVNQKVPCGGTLKLYSGWGGKLPTLCDARKGIEPTPGIYGESASGT